MEGRKQSHHEFIRKPLEPLRPEESFDENLTAKSSDALTAGDVGANADLVSGAIEYGDMNTADAKESGYIDESGKAVSKARRDKPGSPTGAYTDIGAGRSSAVHPPPERKNKFQGH